MIDRYEGTDAKFRDKRVSSENVSIGKVIYRKGAFCGPRIQQDCQILVLHSGQFKLRIDKKTRVVDAGQVILLMPGHREFFRFSRSVESYHTWCSVSPKIVPKALREKLNKAPKTVSNSETLDRLFGVVFSLDPKRSLFTGGLIESLSLTMLWEYIDLTASPEEDPSIDTHYAKAISYMEAHYKDCDCLEKALSRSGVSRTSLASKFKQFEGLTPSRYLWRLRTEKGIGMLADTGLTAAEIAFRCGFRNPYHFSRKVSELHGASPREIRRRSWSSQ